jgi:hypothetical protein
MLICGLQEARERLGMKVPGPVRDLSERQSHCWLCFAKDSLDFKGSKVFAETRPGRFGCMDAQYFHAVTFFGQEGMISCQDNSEIVHFRRLNVLLRSSDCLIAKGCRYTVSSFGDRDSSFIIRFISYCMLVKRSGFLGT